MSNNPICPLCGSTTIKGETFCRSCQEILQNSDLGELENKVVDKSSDRETASCSSTSNKGNRWNNAPEKKIIPRKYFVIGFVTLICLSVTLFYFIHLRTQSKKELFAWEYAVNKNTSSGYSDYLLDYPHGKFSAEAEVKMRKLKEQELAKWYKLRESEDLESLTTYLQEYPNTPFINLIKNRIDQLAWEEAVDENTKMAYQVYIENVEQGNYVGNYVEIARERLISQKEVKILVGEEKRRIVGIAENILTLLAKKEFDTFEKYLADTPANILNIHKTERKLVMDSLKNLYKENTAIVSLIIDAEDATVTRDMNHNYRISSPIFEESRLIEDWRVMTDTAYLHLEFDSDLKINTLIWKEKK